MTTMFEVWDLESGNQIKSFGSEPEALALVRKLVELNGPDYLDDLGLGVVEIHGEGRAPDLLPFVEGDELRARLHAAVWRRP